MFWITDPYDVRERMLMFALLSPRYALWGVASYGMCCVSSSFQDSSFLGFSFRKNEKSDDDEDEDDAATNDDEEEEEGEGEVGEEDF